MVDKSQFLIRPDLIPKIENESLLGSYKNVRFWDKKAQIQVTDLDLQITSHKILVTSSVNKNLAFMVLLENVIEFKEIWEGIPMFKKLVAFKVKYYNQTKIEYRFQNGLMDAITQVRGARNKMEWKKVVQTQKPQNQMEKILQANVYTGMNQLMKKEENLQNQQKVILDSTFQKGDLQSLFQNARELREISEYLKNNINFYDKTREVTETDKILNDLGYFNIVSKEESGNSYTDELVKQIYKMCTDLFPKLGGIITLIDVYYFINKKRSTCLLSANEVLLACQNFQKLGFNAKVNEYDGIKVIESTTFNENEDFQNNIGKYITYEVGITPEQLAKQLKISVSVARIKLNKALSMGKVILADRIEGKIYYKNIILDIK